jgi:hypothetical protein
MRSPGQDDGPRYAAFPVQQLVRSHVHAFQLAFAHEAIARLGDSAEDVVYKPSYKGLRIFGLTEMALPVPGEGDRQVVRRAGQSRTATGTLSVGTGGAGASDVADGARAAAFYWRGAERPPATGRGDRQNRPASDGVRRVGASEPSRASRVCRPARRAHRRKGRGVHVA